MFAHTPVIGGMETLGNTEAGSSGRKPEARKTAVFCSDGGHDCCRLQRGGCLQLSS